MNGVLAVVASVSAAASVLICILLLAEKIWGRKMRWTCWYWLWALVIVRLLVPFGPAWEVPDISVPEAASLTQNQEREESNARALGAAEPMAKDTEEEAAAEPEAVLPGAFALREALSYLWVAWAAGALVLLVRRVTAYQSFNRCIRAGLQPCDNLELLNTAAECAEELGIRRPVELASNSLVTSPLLLGWRRPCIVIPSEDISPDELRSIALHELTHLKRGDAVYKWATQLAVCVHWFNPLVHVAAKRISRLCELSCDEKVVRIVGEGGARGYGQTLLHAMGGAGRFEAAAGSMQLSENKRLIRERISLLKDHTVRKPLTALLTVALAGALVVCTACARIYNPWPRSANTRGGTLTRSEATNIEMIESALETQPALRIVADNAWVRVEYSDAEEIETDFDSGVCSVTAQYDEGSGNRTLFVSGVGAETREAAVVRVPKYMFDRLNIDAESSLIEVPADADIAETRIECDSGLLFVCSNDDFEGVGVRADLANSFVVNPDDFMTSGVFGSSRVEHAGEDCRVMVEADSGVVVFDTDGSAEALARLAQSGFQDAQTWSDLADRLADGPDGGFDETTSGVKGLLSGIGSLLRSIGNDVKGLLTDIGRELKDIGTDLP